VELAVLLKPVPRSEAVRFDPARRTVVRDGVELVVNPFDQRALRVALELRRPEDRLTVIALGPRAARPLLRESLALGADRAEHLCDQAFAGSDVLATSAVLAAALRRLRPGLIVAGARSSDSDTGLVGPEVAARLGLPVLTCARSLVRHDAPGCVEATVDTTAGWATCRVTLPALVTVGEKIAKPLRVDPDRFARTPDAGVREIRAADLGLSTAEVGSFGSPTTVVEVRDVAPTRLGRTFAVGPAADRVRDAVAALEPLVRRPRAAEPPLPWAPARDPAREVSVLVSGPSGDLDPEALGVLAQLRRALPTHTISGIVYGRRPGPAQLARVEAAGALEGYVLDPEDHPFDTADVAQGLGSLLEHRSKLAAFVQVAAPFGREVAGQLAAPRELGAIGDATGVRASEDGSLAWTKPSFGGTTLATIRSRSTPTVATVAPHAPAPAGAAPAGRGIPWTSVTPPTPRARVARGPDHAEAADAPEPGAADVVVAIGTGVGGPEALDRLRPTFRRWGAAVTATRRVVDAGWMPVRRQVGLTGRAYAPRLAVLLGVRGTANHMVGWGRASAVLAVNQDPEAPVFRQADAGIVGTVEEVVPELAGPLENLLAPRA
jgi:electron transfer flavoprotein alpha subunit